MWKILVENTYEGQRISIDSAHMTWTAPTQEMLFCVAFNLWVLISEAVILDIMHRTVACNRFCDNSMHTSFVCRKKKNKLFILNTARRGVFQVRTHHL
jgi:hypothetical protein